MTPEAAALWDRAVRALPRLRQMGDYGQESRVQPGEAEEAVRKAAVVVEAVRGEGLFPPANGES